MIKQFSENSSVYVIERSKDLCIFLFNGDRNLEKIKIRKRKIHEILENEIKFLK